MMKELSDDTTSGMTLWRKKTALDARELGSPLLGSGFFSCYPHFVVEYIRFEKNLGFLVHNTEKYFHRAVTKYFSLGPFKDYKLELVKKPKAMGGLQVTTSLSPN